MMLASDIESTGRKIIYDSSLSDSELDNVAAVSNSFYYTFTLGLVSCILLFGQQNGGYFALGVAYSS
jgi:hypothetical protein